MPDNKKPEVTIYTGVIHSCGSWHFMAPTAPDSLAQGRVRETLGNNDTKPRALKGRHKCALSHPFSCIQTLNTQGLADSTLG